MRKSFLGLAGLSALSLSAITLPVYAYEAGDWLVPVGLSMLIRMTVVVSYISMVLLLVKVSV